MNSTWKHLLNHKRQSVGVIVILAIILVVQLYLSAELWASFYPTDKETLNESCYSFVVADPDKKTIEGLMEDYPKDIKGLLDVQFVGTGLEYHDQVITATPFDEKKYNEWFVEDATELTQEIRVYAPLMPLAERRVNDKGSYDLGTVQDEKVVLLDSWRTYSNSLSFVGKYVYICGQPYEIAGATNIYEVQWDYEVYNQYIGSIDTVLETTEYYEVVFQYNRPLSDAAYKKLASYVGSDLDVIDTKVPYVLNEEKSGEVKKFTVEIVICIAVCLFMTMEFIEYVLENRQKEFRVNLICGASDLYIVKLILYHVSLLCLVAECLGWGAFILLMKCTRLVAIKSVPLKYALINILSFWLLLMIVMAVYLVKDHMQKRKLGLSRIAR